MAEDLQRLIDGFRRVTTASVADAVDRVVRSPGFMSHDVKPIFPARVVGPAVTVLERASLEAQPPRHALEAIDLASPGSVIVIGLEDPQASRDVAVWGGMMTAAASTRRLTGAVLDAGARDVEEIRQAAFPVFSRSIVPSTTVGRYITVARDLPVTCGGVLVHSGDIVVGDADGIVIVLRKSADEVLAVALQIEDAERKMTERIRQTGSILRALDEFARI